ncbi:hypothetical protein [Botrimarina hoheduenensis]|uniref:Uncharacterized protein n=1 Tax=Botrimarina hoheduenensis TaxID=2528000 RepID=A0A5C5WAM3_9BACT|nr:hypothetical protein [Botrimarina hoheduenensis]TWT47215.1 hypothetical protein Pla111_08270 [Botrimarina hoheduenensis]
MPPKNPGDRLSLAWTVLGDLDLSDARVAGPVQLCGVSLVGELLARHATIEGDLDLSGGVAGGGSATQRADILKTVMPEDRLLPRAQWTDVHRRHEPSPRSAQRQARQRDLDLRHATIKGHLGLHGQWVLGTVDLEDAHIGGEANFSRGKVRGNLMLRSATVVGRVFGNETDAAGPYPQVSGAIDARFAKLSEVDLCFSSPQQAADGSPTEVLLSGAKAELIRFRGGPVTREAGREADNRRSPLDLHNLEFKEIDADSYQSSQQPPPLSRWDLARAGLWIMLTAIALYLCRPRGDEGPYVPVVVGSLYAISAIWAWCAAKLRQRGKVSNLRGLLSDARFSPAFYAAVERWLRQAGRDVPADHVFLDRRRRETVHQPVIRVNEDGTVERGAREFSRVQQAYRRWGLDFCLGYGVRPARPLHVFLLLFLINWGMFLDGESVSRSTALVLPPVYLPRTIEAFENKTVKWPELSDSLSPPTPAEWTATAAGFIALRLQLPVIDLVAEGEWNPSGKPIAFTWPVSCRGLKYEDYAALMQVTNLVLLPLIIAGATGFLKQKS